MMVKVETLNSRSPQIHHLKKVVAEAPKEVICYWLTQQSKRKLRNMQVRINYRTKRKSRDS